ncbi:MAG: copper resistance protein CopC, partial [Acidimicrobiia bacterium]|nr:copper resistance protein CopC [Acidimicrobiia bacterium]
MTLAAALLAMVSSPAAAHTRLLETIPENRTIADAPPERLTLVFAEAVDPRTVQLDVIGADGDLVPGAALLTPSGADQAVIEFSLPPLDDGVYGLSWITVGPDGHRVAGEVVVGVGVVDAAGVQEARFSDTPPLEAVLSVAAGVARYLWYFGLAAVAGSLLVLAWGLRPGVGSPAKEILSRRARRALVQGSLLLHVGILVRAGATITLVTRGYRSGSLSEDLQLALVDGMGLTLLLAAVAAGALVVWGTPPRPGGPGAFKKKPPPPPPRGGG